MSTALARHDYANLVALSDLGVRAREYLEASRAPSTRRGYHSDWRMFCRWSEARGIPASLPVSIDTLAVYLTAEADRLSSSTLARRLSALRFEHHRAGLPSPTDHPQIRELMAGIRRVRRDTKRQAKPIYLDDLAASIAGFAPTHRACRNRAMLLVGWWGAFRRAELVRLDRSDVEDHPEGLILRLRHSKTDQEGAGREVPIHYHAPAICPVRALREWMAALPQGGTSIFRRVDRWDTILAGRLSGESVSQVVKDSVERIGLERTLYSAHSLRAGFVSECDRRGIATSAIRLVTGHASDAMLSVYTRPRSLFESSAGAHFDT